MGLRDVPGYEGRYRVSAVGHIRSLPRLVVAGLFPTRIIYGGWLTPRLGNAGYLQVRLGDRLLLVHRVVALAWVPNPHGHRYVNHKDGNKLNNDYLNLEWCTASENELHAHRTGLHRNRRIPNDPCAVCGTPLVRRNGHRVTTCGSAACLSELARRKARREWSGRRCVA